MISTKSGSLIQFWPAEGPMISEWRYIDKRFVCTGALVDLVLPVGDLVIGLAALKVWVNALPNWTNPPPHDGTNLSPMYDHQTKQQADGDVKWSLKIGNLDTSLLWKPPQGTVKINRSAFDLNWWDFSYYMERYFRFFDFYVASTVAV